MHLLWATPVVLEAYHRVVLRPAALESGGCHGFVELVVFLGEAAAVGVLSVLTAVFLHCRKWRPIWPLVFAVIAGSILIVEAAVFIFE